MNRGRGTTILIAALCVAACALSSHLRPIARRESKQTELDAQCVAANAFRTNRAGRYMSHTQASDSRSSK